MTASHQAYPPGADEKERSALFRLIPRQRLDDVIDAATAAIQASRARADQQETTWARLDKTYSNRADDGSLGYHSGAYLVDEFADMAHAMVFGGTDVIRADGAPYDATKAFETQILADGFASAVYDQLHSLALYGTCFAVAQDDARFRTVPVRGFLPDPNTETCRTLDWSCAGYVGQLPSALAWERLKSGRAWLNRSKAEALLRATGSGRVRAVTWWDWIHTTAKGLLRARYEFLGPVDEFLSDLTCTRIAFLDDPSLPIYAAHFYQRPQPYGQSLLERDLDLSQLLNQLIEQWLKNSKVTSVAALLVEMDSPAEAYLDAAGGIEPGARIPATPGLPDEVRPLNLPHYPSGEIAEMIRFLMGQYERRASAMSLRGGSFEGTATASYISRERELEGPRTRVSLYSNLVLEPALQRLWRIWTADQGLPYGDATIQLNLTNSDARQASRANSLERLLQGAPNIDAVLAPQGQTLNVRELLLRYFDALGLTDGRRLVVPATSAATRQTAPPPVNQDARDPEMLARHLQSLANPLAIDHRQ